MSRKSNIDFQHFLNGLNCNPIPLEFTQALTTSEFLHTLLAYVKQVAESAEEINDEIYREFEQKFEALTKELHDKLNDETIIETYLKYLREYCVKYLREMLEDSLKFVTFGLSNDGYFVAYIPDNWNNIQFDTIVDTENSLYGHLLMKW